MTTWIGSAARYRVQQPWPNWRSGRGVDCRGRRCDRYLQLQCVSRQIYRHAVSLERGAAATQKPYNQQLISDALRTELGVPTQASQAEQLKTLQSPAPGR